jgi:hypothetical protein
VLLERAASQLDSFLLISFITGSFRQTLKKLKERFGEIVDVLIIVDKLFDERCCLFSGIEKIP